jgi:HPt (histidine-containing phosphotransfer) domain-containing protein
MAEGICDPQAALARLGDDRELYREVLERFFADAPAALASISMAIDGQRASELHRTAHSFKGLAAVAGADEVTRIAAELEKLGREGNMDPAAALLERARQQLQRARMVLAPYFS